MKKRGNLALLGLVVMVVAVIVFLTYMQVTDYYATGKIALKTAAANDMALIIDAIYASPYDAVVEYDYDLSLFVVEISQNKVTLYDAADTEVDDDVVDSSDNFPSSYSFVPVDDEPEFVLDRPKKIIFSKTNGELTITA